ncbi:MAG: hypothetical protein MZV70_55980 [Desulfobacterales bacterium]|nr:hypothetical protein [Desulfobacterales bacterium]
MTKAFFIDTTTCTGCRGCQVACKQWKKLPAEKTVNRGSFQNPEDLSFTHLQARADERGRDRQEAAVALLPGPVPALHRTARAWRPPASRQAIYKDKATGAVLYTKVTKDLDADEHHRILPLQHSRARGPTAAWPSATCASTGCPTACCRPASRPAPRAP